MRKFDYNQNGSGSMNGNPALPNYIVNLGHSTDGKEWLCQVSPTGHMKHLMWNVDFDTSDTYWVKKDPDWWTDDNDPEEYSSPFLRPEAVYARDGKWAEMHIKCYHRKTVEYINIRKTIEEFCESRGIE